MLLARFAVAKCISMLGGLYFIILCSAALKLRTAEGLSLLLGNYQIVRIHTCFTVVIQPGVPGSLIFLMQGHSVTR